MQPTRAAFRTATQHEDSAACVTNPSCQALIEHVFLLTRRVVITPHIAGVTEMSYRNMAARLASEVRRVQAGHAPSVVLNPLSAGPALAPARSAHRPALAR